MEDAGLEERAVLELLAEARINSNAASIVRIEGGGNNKAFAVTADNATYLAKIYYSNPADTRNRLGAEYSFLSYARGIGLSCVPQPIFCSPAKNMGLYEFVKGRKLATSDLTLSQVMEAARFIRALNARQDRDPQLPVASEGAFSISQHFSLIDRRVGKLRALPVETEIDRQALAFVGRLESCWEMLKADISAESLALPDALDEGDRCISPSDFGFHNALLRDSGEICFIDFEYAGWDDPAKLVGDFFSQPAVPVPMEFFDAFLEEALSYSENKKMLEVRVRLLLPIFLVKWCCIMLNEFLPDAARRRQFANPELGPEQRKRIQLDKVQHFFNSRLGETWLT